MILSAFSNVICFLICTVSTMSTCMFYNYCVRRSTVSALCALFSCSVAICQMIMLCVYLFEQINNDDDDDDDIDNCLINHINWDLLIECNYY